MKTVYLFDKLPVLIFVKQLFNKRMEYCTGLDFSHIAAFINIVKKQVFLVKHLPHKLVMKVWMKQQKHDKRPDED